MTVDPFTPGPSFDELADQAVAGIAVAAPRDLMVDGVLIPAGTVIPATTLRRAGINMVVPV